VEGLKTVSSELKDRLNLYFKFFIILYADDTVIMAESAANLQKQLDSFSDYCDIWRLKLNVEKSKIVGFFSQGRTPNNFKFDFNGKQPEIVDEFNYLGVLLTKNCNFNKSKMFAVNKGTKAMYEVLKLGRIHTLSINCQLDLFDKMVKPTLLYGCEICGYGNIEIIERVPITFCKLLLQLKNSTPTYMIYGESSEVILLC
jgi:hypothetical protein